MIKDQFVAVATLSTILTLSINAQAQRLPPDVVVIEPAVYEVTITTKLVVPRTGKTITGLGVWHALPNSRPWDGLDRTMGAFAITFSRPAAVSNISRPTSHKTYSGRSARR